MSPMCARVGFLILVGKQNHGVRCFHWGIAALSPSIGRLTQREDDRDERT